MLLFGLALMVGGIGVLVAFRDEYDLRRRWWLAPLRGLATLTWRLATPAPRGTRVIAARAAVPAAAGQAPRSPAGSPAAGSPWAGSRAVGRAAALPREPERDQRLASGDQSSA